MNNTKDAIPPFDAAHGPACCFTCMRWIGKRKRDKAWCSQLLIATEGKAACRLWVKRPNARSTPNVKVSRCGENVAAPANQSSEL